MSIPHSPPFYCPIFSSSSHTFLPFSWFVYKHARPLPEEIVRFPPYNEKEDTARGTTVQPYLEAFYHYDSGNSEEQAPPHLATVATATTWDPFPALTPPPQTLGQQMNWLSEDPCYLLDREVYSRGSNNSSDKTDHSTENIAMKKSRIPSRENGERVRNLIACGTFPQAFISPQMCRL